MQDLLKAFQHATEAGALAATDFIGKGDKEAGDKAAVDALRLALNAIDFQGTVIIGEGEKDKAPMLFNGEKVGTGNGPKLDIAVDPVEGTALLAADLPKEPFGIRGLLFLCKKSLWEKKQNTPLTSTNPQQKIWLRWHWH